MTFRARVPYADQLTDEQRASLPRLGVAHETPASPTGSSASRVPLKTPSAAGAHSSRDPKWLQERRARDSIPSIDMCGVLVTRAEYEGIERKYDCAYHQQDVLDYLATHRGPQPAGVVAVEALVKIAHREIAARTAAILQAERDAAEYEQSADRWAARGEHEAAARNLSEVTRLRQFVQRLETERSQFQAQVDALVAKSKQATE